MSEPTLNSDETNQQSSALHELSRIVGEGVGEASVCWEHMDGTGEFDSTRASAVVNRIIDASIGYVNSLWREESFQDKARHYVFEYVKAHLEKTDTHVTFGQDEVYVVWSCYILGGWKCLVSTSLPDGMYYEVTHAQDRKKTFLDAYKKFDNITISEGEDRSA